MSSGRIKAYKTLITDNETLNRVQDRVSEALTAIQLSDIIDGVKLENVELLTGQVNSVNHKLGRKLRGWFITRKRALSDVWDNQDANNSPTKTLQLSCTQNVVVDLWVF